MNGRVYDYNLGRFLSVDPFIQDPSNSQSMNPYSYIMNNLLAGTDPSGYSILCTGGTSVSDRMACGTAGGVSQGTIQQSLAHTSGLKTAMNEFGGSGWQSNGRSLKSKTVNVKESADIGNLSSTSQGSLGANAADNFGSISDEVKAMASKFLDPSKRFKEYRRIGNELIGSGQAGAGEWFLLAADQVEAIAVGFEGGTGMLALVNNGGPGSVNAMFVKQDVSYRLSQYNFQNYLDIKSSGSIRGLEGIRGKSLAIEMAGFEQQIGQGLLKQSLSIFSSGSQRSIVNNINERFNGGFDRFVGGVSPSYISNTIGVLNRLYPNQNFRFDKQQDRLNLAIGLIDDQFSRAK